jgi:alpha-tubulin suppressor-like RCC1 family protein
MSACAPQPNLFAWGNNFSGQLGDGTTTSRPSPTPIGDATDWSAISAGAAHSCGLLGAGSSLWCWGHNAAGQLGDGTTTQRSSPTQIGALATDWSAVTAGGLHTCALRETGTLWCWGSNSSGQLGDGTTTNRQLPTQIGTATDWRAISAGGSHTCGMRASGTLWCWGSNTYGQLGDGTTTPRTVPTQIGTAADWSAISTSRGHHSCGLRGTGSLWCWGRNNVGQLGDDTTTERHSPTQIFVATDWIAISAGEVHTCGLRGTGTLRCWGSNVYGQVGDGTTTNRLRPTQIGTATDWRTVSAGTFHTCALRGTGSTSWCWGRNHFGQLGDETTTQRLVPTQSGGNADDWSAITVGGAYTLGLR